MAIQSQPQNPSLIDHQDNVLSKVAHYSVSVVMPVRNEEEHIAATLQKLVQQKHDGIDVEILVIDGCSTDRTRDTVLSFTKKHPEVRLLENPRVWSSSARNIGISNSRGDFLVVIDGHCEIPTDTYIKDLVAAFERTKADCLGRPQPLDVSDSTSLQRAIAVARSSWLGHHPDSFIYSQKERVVPALSVAAAYRRQIFEIVGLFDESFDACEDCELNHRVDKAGLSCYLVPELSIRYKPRASLGGLFRQLLRYGRGRVRLLKKHRDSFSVGSVVPACFVAGLLIGPILCLFFPVLWSLYWGLIGVYLLLIFVASLGQAIALRSASQFFWLPAVFAAIHAGSGCGVLFEVVASFVFRRKRS